MADILGDIADPKVQAMFKKHWPWFVAGGIGLLGVAYWYFSSQSSSTGTTASSTSQTPTTEVIGASSGTTGSNPVDDTAINDQTQVALASIAAQAQNYGAYINAQTVTNQQNTITGGENYQTLVNASATQTNTLAAVAAQQNETFGQILEQGFSSYATSTAQIASSAASGAASTAAANDAANGSNVLSGVLTGVGSIVAGLNNPLSSLMNLGGATSVAGTAAKTTFGTGTLTGNSAVVPGVLISGNGATPVIGL
jgi:hypothetical protein